MTWQQFVDFMGPSSLWTTIALGSITILGVHIVRLERRIERLERELRTGQSADVVRGEVISP